MNNKKIISVLLLVMTAMIWGASFVFQMMGAAEVDAYTFCGGRMTLAAIAVGIVVMILERSNSTGFTASDQNEASFRKNTVVGGICCGACLAIALILQQMGMPYTTAGKAGFITALYIIIIPLMGWLFLRRKNSLITWIAVFTGVAGMFLLCVNPDENLIFSKGDLLILTSSLCYGVHLFFCDHFTKIGNPLKISAIQFVVAAILSWIAAFLLGSPSIEGLRAAIIPFLYCGLMSGGAGYTLQIIAQRYVDPVRATLILSTESVFAVIFGVLLLGERMTGRELVGCFMMVIAIFIVQLPQKVKH